jgi:hypothetical protein
MISHMDMFGMLLMDGFQDSKGMAEELRFARHLHKHVEVVSILGIEKGTVRVGRITLPTDIDDLDDAFVYGLEGFVAIGAEPILNASLAVQSFHNAAVQG